MATIDGRLCTKTIKDYVEYKQLVRRIVDAQNKEAKLFTKINNYMKTKRKEGYSCLQKRKTPIK